jgi:hypothetical protein
MRRDLNLSVRESADKCVYFFRGVWSAAPLELGEFLDSSYKHGGPMGFGAGAGIERIVCGAAKRTRQLYPLNFKL